MAASSSSGTPKPAKKAAKKAPAKKAASSGKTGPVTNQQVHDELAAHRKFLEKELPGILADKLAGVTGSQHRKILSRVKELTAALNNLDPRFDSVDAQLSDIMVAVNTRRPDRRGRLLALIVGLAVFGVSVLINFFRPVGAVEGLVYPLMYGILAAGVIMILARMGVFEKMRAAIVRFLDTSPPPAHHPAPAPAAEAETDEEGDHS